MAAGVQEEENGNELAFAAIVVQRAGTGGRRGTREIGGRGAGQRCRTGAQVQRVRLGRSRFASTGGHRQYDAAAGSCTTCDVR